jgi:hypothetical protein
LLNIFAAPRVGINLQNRTSRFVPLHVVK